MSDAVPTPQHDPSIPSGRNRLLKAGAAATLVGAVMLAGCEGKPAEKQPSITPYGSYAEGITKLKELAAQYEYDAALPDKDKKIINQAVEATVPAFSTEVSTRVDALVTANSGRTTTTRANGTELGITHDEATKNHYQTDIISIKKSTGATQNESDITVIKKGEGNFEIGYRSISTSTEGKDVTTVRLNGDSFEVSNLHDDDGNVKSTADQSLSVTTFEHEFGDTYSGPGVQAVSRSMQSVTTFLDQADSLLKP